MAAARPGVRPSTDAAGRRRLLALMALGRPLPWAGVAGLGAAHARAAPNPPAAAVPGTVTLDGLMRPWKAATPPAPELMDMAGRATGLAAWRGRWLVLNVWATWCGPCKEEMPSLDRLRVLVAPNGMEVLAISLGDSINQIETFVARTPVHMPILVDTRRAMARAWQVNVLPTTFVVDPDGRIRYSHIGPREWDEPRLVAALRSLATR